VSSPSTSQRLVLATAAARPDGAILPLPAGFRVRGHARRLMLQGMLKRGLIAERPAQDGQPAWAQGGGDFALEITPEGRALVGSADAEPSSPAGPPFEPTTPRAKANAPALELDAASKGRPAVRPGTKQALLLELLHRPEGATIAEIQQATGWQPHTARAAITGLKKKNFAVTSAPRQDGARAYRLSADRSDPAGAPARSARASSR
jgi:Protein of unknown function (DUF3489)